MRLSMIRFLMSNVSVYLRDTLIVPMVHPDVRFYEVIYLTVSNFLLAI